MKDEELLRMIKNFFVLIYKFATTSPVHYCNCICHNPVSSIAWCEHCKGVNAVSEDKKKREHARLIAMEYLQGRGYTSTFEIIKDVNTMIEITKKLISQFTDDKILPLNLEQLEKMRKSLIYKKEK